MLYYYKRVYTAYVRPDAAGGPPSCGRFRRGAGL